MKAAIRGESRGFLPVRRLRGWLVPAYLLVLLLGAGALFQPTGALAAPLSVTIDTSFLPSGTAAQLDFVFIDGGLLAVNTVAISSLAVTGGSIGVAAGDAACDPPAGTCSAVPPPYPVTLSETTLLDNHLLQRVTLGSSVAFTFDLTSNVNVGDPVPDSFGFFILKDVDPLSIYADLLVDTDLGGTLFVASSDGSVLVAGATSPSVPTSVTAVPAPSALLLSVLGLAAISLRGIRRRPRQPTLS